MAAMAKLAECMSIEEDQKFEDCLMSLSVLFQKGYSYLFTTYSLLMRKMMNHFTKLGKQLDVTGNKM